MQLLTSEERQALARTLPDRPETAISVHLLTRGLCRALVAGTPSAFTAAVVQGTEDPHIAGEPSGFGSDANAMWELLESLEGWYCVSVSDVLAPELGGLIAARTGRGVRYYGDISYRLAKPLSPIADERIRRFTPEDLPLLSGAHEDIRPRGFGSIAATLAEGVVAGAVIGGAVVAISFTYARTPRHADIAVVTLLEFRGRGLATAAASVVIEEVQRMGLVPVWSTGEDNHASKRVAGKLGFMIAGHQTYVILA